MTNVTRPIAFLMMLVILLLCSPVLAQFETATPEGDTVPMQPADDLDAIESVPEVDQDDTETQPVVIEDATVVTLTDDQLQELINEARNEGTGWVGAVLAITLAGAFAVALYAIYIAGAGAPPWLAPLFTEGGRTLYAGTSAFLDARIEEAKETPSELDDHILQAVKDLIDKRFAEFYNNPPEAVG